MPAEATPSFEKTLACTPVSRWRWDYEVRGAAPEPAIVKITSPKGDGTITVGDSAYVIRRHGWFKERYTLELEGNVVAEALKPQLILRSFELSLGQQRFTVVARAPLSNTFDVVERGAKVGEVRRPKGPSKDAVLECTAALPEQAQLFAFWLALLCWYRSANSGSD